jgi:acetolactate synthase I/II/III large subunit
MRAAQSIVESLKAHAVKRVYCVPGESYLALLDALYGSGIDVIVCRHEGGAGFMAVAEAKLSGVPGVVLVSRGPGATNVSIAAHMAEQDAVPLLILIGQVSREERSRGVFQEVNYGGLFGDFAKGIFEVTEGTKLHELMPRSLRLAAEGVAGPVVIALPEDMLKDEVPVLAAVPPYPLPQPSHNSAQVLALQTLIDHADRPMVIAGARLRGSAGALALQKFAEAQRVPIATSWKSQDVFDNRSPLYAGHLGFGTPASHKDLLAESDLIIAVGTRLGDVASLGFTFPQAPQPRQKFAHIYPDGRPIGLVTRPDLAIIAAPAPFLTELAATARVVSSAREAWNSRLSQFMEKFQTFETREVSILVKLLRHWRNWHRKTPSSQLIPAMHQPGYTAIGK